MTNQQREKITELRGQGLATPLLPTPSDCQRTASRRTAAPIILGKIQIILRTILRHSSVCIVEKSLCIRREKGRRNSAARNADRHGGIHIRRRSGEERSIPLPAVIAASLSPLTATAVENTAVTIAIFLTGSGQVTADEQRRITERYALSRRPFNCRRNACEPPDYRTGIR